MKYYANRKFKITAFLFLVLLLIWQDTWSYGAVNEPTRHLKIYTDSTNVGNKIFYDADITDGNLQFNSNNYLPEGTHKIIFELSIISILETTTQTHTRYVQVQNGVTYDVTNNYKTFHVNVSIEAKSINYYKYLNEMLKSSVYLLNILQEPNKIVNEGYIGNITGITDVTGQGSYTGSRLYTKDTLDSKKIINWIDSSMPANGYFQVYPVGATMNISNIMFTDDEKDYLSTSPINRGKNRQFRISQFPGELENITQYVAESGIWFKEDQLTTFDGQSVSTLGESKFISISKAGMYRIEVKESDDVKNIAGLDFSKFSNNAFMDIYYHNYPVAAFQATDNGNGTVKLINNSYDIDFFSQANKGIQASSWAYRKLDTVGNILQGWTEIGNINAFPIDPTVRTDIKLTVTDMGAFKAITGDGELSSDYVMTIDQSGMPPVANFEIKVGTTDTNAVPSSGVIYKGNAGKETVQLDTSFVEWNDLLATSGTQSAVWSVPENTMNTQISSQNSVGTSLTAANKFGLSDTKTKTATVKTINLENSTPASVTAGKSTSITFSTSLSSPQGLTSSVDLDVKLTSASLGASGVNMNSTGSNGFSLNRSVPSTLAGSIPYTIHVSSRRTGEAIASITGSCAIITPLTVTAQYSGIFPANSIPASEGFDLVGIQSDCPIDVSNLRFALYQGGVRKTTEIQLNNPADISAKSVNIWRWNNISRYLIPAALSDGNYTLQLTATAENGATATWTQAVTVNTPINLVPNMPSELTNGDVSYIEADTSKYANSVTVRVFNGTPYEVFLPMNGTLDGVVKDWAASFTVAEEIPEAAYSAVFTATSPNGNTQTVTVSFNLLGIKLTNLRITKITDPQWKSYFVLRGNDAPTALQQKGISVKDLPVYRTKEHNGIKLGYTVYFKIDSTGLSQAGDTIEISARYYASDPSGNIYEADIWTENKAGNYIPMNTSEYEPISGNILLSSSSRHGSETDPSNPKQNTWSFLHYLPYSAKVVKKGESLDLIADNTMKFKLLVVFEVTGRRSTGQVYKYSQREVLWGVDSGSTYGGNKPTGLELLNCGAGRENNGEMYWYNLNENARDDLDTHRKW